MNQDIKIKTDNYNFKFRVSGIVIVENKLLVTDMVSEKKEIKSLTNKLKEL